MFTRQEAIKFAAEKYKGLRSFGISDERRIEILIDLHEPFFDGLKEGGPGLDEKTAEHFRACVTTYSDNEKIAQHRNS